MLRPAAPLRRACVGLMRRSVSTAPVSKKKARVLLLAESDGVGKSKLAVELAQRLGGEVVRCVSLCAH